MHYKVELLFHAYLKVLPHLSPSPAIGIILKSPIASIVHRTFKKSPHSPIIKPYHAQLWLYASVVRLAPHMQKNELMSRKGKICVCMCVLRQSVHSSVGKPTFHKNFVLICFELCVCARATQNATPRASSKKQSVRAPIYI